MSQFTTRVELHHASADDYNRLHTVMEAKGFSRWITADNGTRYLLPTAEYDRVGQTLTIQQVVSDASTAAASLKQGYAVIVTQANGRQWVGLLQAK
jgi:hypothetical protein